MWILLHIRAGNEQDVKMNEQEKIISEIFEDIEEADYMGLAQIMFNNPSQEIRDFIIAQHNKINRMRLNQIKINMDKVHIDLLRSKNIPLSVKILEPKIREYVLHGHTNVQIGEKLGFSDKTIKRYREILRLRKKDKPNL